MWLRLIVHLLLVATLVAADVVLREIPGVGVVVVVVVVCFSAFRHRAALLELGRRERSHRKMVPRLL